MSDTGKSSSVCAIRQSKIALQHWAFTAAAWRSREDITAVHPLAAPRIGGVLGSEGGRSLKRSARASPETMSLLDVERRGMQNARTRTFWNFGVHVIRSL